MSPETNFLYVGIIAGSRLKCFDRPVVLEAGSMRRENFLSFTLQNYP